MTKKIILAFGVATLVLGLFFALRFYAGNPRVIILNESNRDMNTIEIIVSGNSYTLDNVGQGEEKAVRINPNWDSNIKLVINKKDTSLMDTYLDQSSTGGFIKARITTDSLISFKYERGLL